MSHGLIFWMSIWIKETNISWFFLKEEKKALVLWNGQKWRFETTSASFLFNGTIETLKGSQLLKGFSGSISESSLIFS